MLPSHTPTRCTSTTTSVPPYYSPTAAVAVTTALLNEASPLLTPGRVVPTTTSTSSPSSFSPTPAYLVPDGCGVDRESSVAAVVADGTRALAVAANNQALLEAQVVVEREMRERAEADLATFVRTAGEERAGMLATHLEKEQHNETTLRTLQTRLEALEHQPASPLPSFPQSMAYAVEQHCADIASLATARHEVHESRLAQRCESLTRDSAEKDRLVVMLQQELQNVSTALEETTSAGRHMAYAGSVAEAQIAAVNAGAEADRSALSDALSQISALSAAAEEATAALVALETAGRIQEVELHSKAERVTQLQEEVARMTEACEAVTHCNESLRSELATAVGVVEFQSEKQMHELSRKEVSALRDECTSHTQLRVQHDAIHDREVSELCEERDNLIANLRQLESDLSIASQSLDANATEIAVLRDELAQSKEDNALLQSTSHGPQTNDSRLRESLRLTEQENDALRMKVLSLCPGHDSSFDDRSAQDTITAQNATIAQLSAEIAAIRSTHDAAQQQQAVLLQTHTSQREEALRMAAGVTAECETLRLSNSARERETDVLQQRCDAEIIKERRLRERLEVDMTELITDRERLVGDMVVLNAKLQRLEAACIEERSVSAQVAKVSVVGSRRVAELEADVARLEAAASNYEVALAGNRSTVASLEAANKALSMRDAERESVLLQLVEAEAYTEAKMARLIDDKESAHEEVDAIRQAFADLERTRPVAVVQPSQHTSSLASDLATVARTSAWVMKQLTAFYTSLAASSRLTQEELQAKTAYLLDLVSMAVK